MKRMLTWAAITLGGLLLNSALAAEPEPANASQPRKTARRNVAILLFDRVELLDFAGPGEVFAGTNLGTAFRVYTVAESAAPLKSQGFVEITPEYTIADCPQPDILVIPGGGVGAVLKSEPVIEWVKKTAADAEQVVSVCNGALVLAKAGLLDGLEATTHHGSIGSLKRTAPKTTVHADRRFVDNGKVVTTAGVSAGIDGALHVVSKLLGEKTARRTATYMEYDWEPERFKR